MFLRLAAEDMASVWTGELSGVLLTVCFSVFLPERVYCVCTNFQFFHAILTTKDYRPL